MGLTEIIWDDERKQFFTVNNLGLATIVPLKTPEPRGPTFIIKPDDYVHLLNDENTVEDVLDSMLIELSKKYGANAYSKTERNKIYSSEHSKHDLLGDTSFQFYKIQ